MDHQSTSKLKIWGRTNSINVQKVLWVCEDLAIDYTRIDAGMEHGVNKQPEYLDMNPNGLVPTISDNGFLLWESHSIMRYLVKRQEALAGVATPRQNEQSLLIYPNDPQAAGTIDQWLDWINTVAWPAMRPIFWGWVRLKPEERDMVALENSRQLMIKALGMLDERLSKSPFVAGQHFSIADIPLALILFRWLNIAVEKPEFTYTLQWYQRVGERAGFKKYCTLPLT